MRNEQQHLAVTVVFNEGPNFECELDPVERDRLLDAFVAYVNAPVTSSPGGTYVAWAGAAERRFALDFRQIKYIY